MVKDYTDWVYSSFNIILNEEETKMAREIVLRYFAYENDKSGKSDFLLQHEKFKKNFTKRQNTEKFRILGLD